MMSSWLLTIIMALLLVTGSSLEARSSSSDISSPSSSCGNVEVSCPFYLQGHPQKCHNFSYELSCQNGRTILQLSGDKFYVEAISYVNSSVRIIDSGLPTDNYSCSSMPLHPFFNKDKYVYGRGTFSPVGELNSPITYIDCPAPVMNSSTTRRYKPAPPCTWNSSYVVIGYMDSSEVESHCRIRKTTWVSSAWPFINRTSFLDIHNIMAYGIELPFKYLSCLTCPPPPSPYCRAVATESFGSYCVFLGGWFYILTWYPVVLLMRYVGVPDYAEQMYFYFYPAIIGHVWLSLTYGLIDLFSVTFFATRFLCGIAFLSVLLVYKLRRRHTSANDTIEDFLQGQNNLMPIRYSYSQIKKIKRE